ncbi:MAG: tRNA (N6-isopentenyl adenosine(37)-C2)-methylthiotransferase MiaB [Alphaproteobacteria bacterium]|nr:tRNA (N6-isopentenyl adenosine(37)-C2)-methylthiotransferase MiaB [Alphaproteobacteria bacterium]
MSMKFFIKSYGCQMNLYDSQRIEDLLLSYNHEKVNSPEQANLLIFNTCSIREKADEKLFSDLGRAKLLKNQNKGKEFVIAVMGCVAQSRCEDIKSKHPYVDIILGPQEVQNMQECIMKVLNNQITTTLALTDFKSKNKFEVFNKNEIRDRLVSEYLTIQEGCDNFCTYCVVPYTRGREFSRSVQEIIVEAKNLVSRGCKEITLLGQNVNSYNGVGDDGMPRRLSILLEELASISGLSRLRYTTSHPKDIDENIGKAHRDIPILMPFLHLPVQSGSNEILRRMNRKYDREKYFDVIDMLRSYRPDIAFSSDFIVGFPGETENDFEDTLDLIKRVGYSQAYSFKYSPRPHTPAAKMDSQVEESVKSSRLRILQDLLNFQQRDFNKMFIGKMAQVLFVKEGRDSGQLSGRDEYFQAVSVMADKSQIGSVVEVKIVDAASHSLIGELK